jgi:hypothetical protein
MPRIHYLFEFTALLNDPLFVIGSAVAACSMRRDISDDNMSAVVSRRDVPTAHFFFARKKRSHAGWIPWRRYDGLGPDGRSC